MLILSRIIVNCLLLLILTYAGLSKDLIDCDDGPQGDESDQQIQCDPSKNSSETVDCSFVIIMESADYETINCVKIFNQGNETTDGTPKIAVGGVGHNFLFGDVYSKPGQGVNYTVSIWAKPINKSDTTLPPTTPTPPTTTTIITTTVTESTASESTTIDTTITTQKISTTTSGSTKSSACHILVISVFTYYVLNFTS